jgi:hypothetical protein
MFVGNLRKYSFKAFGQCIFLLSGAGYNAAKVTRG